MRLELIRGAAAAMCAIAILSALAGCARPVGDLGRAAPSVLHDEVMPAVGRFRAAADGEPVSDFNLTDQEREMHDRVWRFLVAPHAKDWFYDTAVELQRTRLTRETDLAFSPDRYYEHLRSERYASSRVRYQTVASDIGHDLATIPATFVAICRVIEVDRQRAIAVGNVRLGAPDSSQQVAARKWENERRIDWFVRALGYRYDSYSTALDRLLVETPHEEARIVDLRLEEMEVYVRRARARDFCGGAGAGFIAKDAPLPSRLQTQVYVPEPVVRK
ncbi:hypothetical protein [Pelagibacterium limicola]|uniref:hypothetical protein n=1 Tax=Pelagibacterium limicola TaxID=2791022 RepID=UPI0018AFBAD9|nr:hypothetical protein [Pelagibacterium limicola]